MAPRAHQGVLDLRQWSFERDGPVDLGGEYSFHWRGLIDPSGEPTASSGLLEVPRAWNGQPVDGETLGGQGYGSYRLRVLLPPSHGPLGLKLLDMGTASTAWANGAHVVSVGEPGTSAEATEPRYFPQVVALPTVGDRLDLVFHVANFHHRRGGAWEAIRLGSPRDLHRERERRLSLDALLFGSIFIIGLYHLVGFAARGEDRSALLFGVFCLLIALRLLTTVERILVQVFPSIDWALLVRIEYLSAYLALPVFTLFLRSLFPQAFHRLVVTAIVTTSGLLGLVVVLTPPRTFTLTLVPFQALLLASIAWGLAMLSRALRQGQEGSGLFLLGVLILGATAVNDVLDANNIIQTGHFIHLGLFPFIVLQAFYLSLRAARAARVIARQREELALSGERHRVALEERIRAERESADLQERFQRAQRMEAVGLLAGGVAHELNNLLSGIVGYPDLLLADVPSGSHLRQPLEAMKSAGLRAAAVVDDLLTLARRQTLEPEPLSLDRLVEVYLRSSEHRQLLREHPQVAVDVHVAEKRLPVDGSRSALRRALANLVSNACQAQPDGGLVVLRTELRRLGGPREGYETIPEGAYAVLGVEDLGPAIPAEHLQSLFEPFYLKRRLRPQASGLGMAVVWGAVKGHGGYVDVRSAVGEGTAIELYLPLSDVQIPEGQKPAEASLAPGQGESILVIEDEQDQRRLAKALLEDLGYSVITVASGEEGVRLLEETPVDVCLLDMILGPGIDGLTTAERIAVLRPDTPIVIVSGYAETGRLRQAVEKWARGHLKKPYTVDKMARAIRSVLDARDA